MSDTLRITDRPEYRWFREFKSRRGKELLTRYKAHGLGIGWKRNDGEQTDQLALIFYVSPDRPQDADTIPSSFAFTPSNRKNPVELPARVVETSAMEFE